MRIQLQLGFFGLIILLPFSACFAASSHSRDVKVGKERPSRLHLSTSCHGLTSRAWTTTNVSRAIHSWLDSAVSLDGPIDDKHPSLRSIFSNHRPHFISAAPMANGISWKRFGGENELDGWLYGKLNDKSTFSGDAIAFLYPDLETALLGNFDEEKLIEARAARVVACRCQNGVLELRFRLRDPPSSREVIVPDPLRYLSLPKTALVVDPIDRRNVFVAPSGLGGGSGEGLFAKRDLQKGSLVVTYAGMLQSAMRTESEFCNAAMTESYAKNLIKWRSYLRIDVPFGHEDVSVYRATLGHKANHAFDNNGDYEFYKSPRFGRVRCIQANRDIKKGQEIFANYGYNLDSVFTPRWYKRAHSEYMKGSGQCANYD